MKPILLKVLTVFWLALWFSCGPKDRVADASVDIRNSENQILTLDTFSTFPPEIDGCTCYFSNDAVDFKKGRYIYLNDYAETSFLKINGVLTKFRQTDFQKIDSSTVIAKATADRFEMTIEVRDSIQNGDETWLKSGKIKVTDQTGRTVEKVFFGECGC